MSKSAKYLVEVLEDKPRALLVYQQTNKFIKAFAKTLSQTHIIYETSPDTEKWSGFDLVVFLGTIPDLNQLRTIKKVYFIFFNQQPEYQNTKQWLEKHHRQYKIINLGRSQKTIAELVDYVIFQTPVPYSFDLGTAVPQKPWVKASSDPKQNLLLSLKIVAGLIVLLNTLFVITFLAEWLLLFGLMRAPIQPPKLLRTQIAVLSQTKKINQSFKAIPQHTLFWLPGIDSFLGFVDTTNTSVETIVSGAGILDSFGTISSLITKQNKNPGEVAEIKLRLTRLKKQLRDFSSNYYFTLSLWQKTSLPFVNRQKQQYLVKIRQIEDYLVLATKLSERLPSMLGAGRPKKYLVLFMNNMELRPGGGFIGSVATLNFNQYSLKDFKVYDVYTLDGQLKAHVDPPLPIRNHLNQPHWFLRDSNFSPDFSVNALEATRFLKREVDWNDFDGVFGITLTAVQKILGLFPDFYLADYNETINTDNFFIKAQTYAERDFFPGSHQKKDFLQSVLRALIIKLEQADFDAAALVMTLRDVFEEKFGVVYFGDSQLQAVADELFWTGRVVSTECNFSDRCFSDYVYVVDANLGVNKANYYVQRTIRLNTVIGTDRSVLNTLTLDYYNESISQVFPGGNYKNYLQVFLPKNTVIKELLLDGEPVSQYDVATELGLRKLGLLFNVAEGSQTNVVVRYEFVDKLENHDQYQLIVQKQTGSINSDFIYAMQLPMGLSLKQSNFSPIVTKEGFVYNTFLQKDRILIVDFN